MIQLRTASFFNPVSSVRTAFKAEDENAVNIQSANDHFEKTPPTNESLTKQYYSLETRLRLQENNQDPVIKEEEPLSTEELGEKAINLEVRLRQLMGKTLNPSFNMPLSVKYRKVSKDPEVIAARFNSIEERLQNTIKKRSKEAHADSRF